MVDVLSPEQRRRCMSRIRGSDTKPELLLRRALWAMGLRYRVKSGLSGRPDLTFARSRVVVFVDGCFWHACPQHRTVSKTNAVFWKTKIERNIQRDQEVTAALQSEEWLVLRFWEHEVERSLLRVVTRIERAVRK